MSRRFVFALVVLVLSLVIPLTALAQGDESQGDEGQEEETAETGSISGQVVNGTKDGGNVDGLEVTVTRFEGMDPVETYTATVGEDGSYEFTDLPAIDGQAYLAEVTYEGIDFNSGMILLSQEPDTEREITVYEQTNDSSALQILSRGIVVASANEEEGYVEILEIIALENESDRVYVGDESGEVLRLAMPENAGEISPQAGFDFGQMSLDDNVLVSTGAVTPGSHNPMITYQVPYSGTSGEITVGTAMQTGTLRILVEEDSYNLESDMLQPAGQTQVGESSYDVMAVESPVVGDSFTVQITDLPRENWNLPISMSAFLASIAAGIGLVVGAILIYQVVQRRQRAAAPAAAGADGDVDFDEMSQDDLEQERMELASELNRLDADYERGDIDEERYNSERSEILTELRSISLRMRGVEE